MCQIFKNTLFFFIYKTELHIEGERWKGKSSMCSNQLLPVSHGYHKKWLNLLHHNIAPYTWQLKVMGHLWVVSPLAEAILSEPSGPHGREGFHALHSHCWLAALLGTPAAVTSGYAHKPSQSLGPNSGFSLPILPVSSHHISVHQLPPACVWALDSCGSQGPWHFPHLWPPQMFQAEPIMGKIKFLWMGTEQVQ